MEPSTEKNTAELGAGSKTIADLQPAAVAEMQSIGQPVPTVAMPTWMLDRIINTLNGTIGALQRVARDDASAFQNLAHAQDCARSALGATVLELPGALAELRQG